MSAVSLAELVQGDHLLFITVNFNGNDEQQAKYLQQFLGCLPSRGQLVCSCLGTLGKVLGNMNGTAVNGWRGCEQTPLKGRRVVVDTFLTRKTNGRITRGDNTVSSPNPASRSELAFIRPFDRRVSFAADALHLFTASPHTTSKNG